MATYNQPQPSTVIGTISKFKPEKEQCVNYKKKLDAWMRISKINDSDKVPKQHSILDPVRPQLGQAGPQLGPIWESCLGRCFYISSWTRSSRFLVALVSPATIEGKTYAQLSELL